MQTLLSLVSLKKISNNGNQVDGLHVQSVYRQGRIELPKVARGHVTFCSLCIDSIVLSVTKNSISGYKHVKNHVRYDYECSMESFPGEMSATKRIATDFSST